jgi:uncharacterized membrane protein YgcG
MKFGAGNTVRLCAAGLIAVSAALSAPVARADGAFPGSESILTPAALPHHIILATNFGLVTSRDDGATWTWSCEQTLSELPSLYQMGAPPLNRIYAVGTNGLVFTDDQSCTWALARGLTPGTTLLDAFPDPSDVDRVLAIAAGAAEAGVTFEILESTNAGATFEATRYTAAAGDQLTGVEIAPSSSSIVYLTMTVGRAFVPALVRSDDGGVTWVVRDLGAALGAGTNQIRLIAIDPEDPDTVYLRVGSSTGERLAITHDGGLTVSTPVTFDGGVLTAFARLPSGALVVAGALKFQPVAYRSRDRGATFEPLAPPAGFRAFGTRADLLYGVTEYGPTDMMPGRWAIGVSHDEGTTWTPLFTYDQVRAIEPCIKSQCQVDCLTRAGLGQWPATFCAADPGSAGQGGGGGGGQGGATGGAGGEGGGQSSGDGGGCRCAVLNGSGAPIGTLLLAAIGLRLLARRRSRRLKS